MSKEIKMTSIDGVTLPTANKYVTEDIHITNGLPTYNGENEGGANIIHKKYRHEIVMSGWEGIDSNIRGSVTLYSQSNKPMTTISEIIEAINSNRNFGTVVPIYYKNNERSYGTAALYSPDGCSLWSRGTITAECLVCEGDYNCGPYGTETPYGGGNTYDGGSSNEGSFEYNYDKLQVLTLDKIDNDNWYNWHLYKANYEDIDGVPTFVGASIVTEESELIAGGPFKLGVDLSPIGEGVKYFTGDIGEVTKNYTQDESGEEFISSIDGRSITAPLTSNIEEAVDIFLDYKEGDSLYRIRYSYIENGQPLYHEVVLVLGSYGVTDGNYQYYECYFHIQSVDSINAMQYAFSWNAENNCLTYIYDTDVLIGVQTTPVSSVVPSSPYTNPYSGPYGSGCTNPNCSCELQTILCNGEIVNFEQIMDIVTDDSDFIENTIRYIFKTDLNTFYLTTDPNYTLTENEIETDEAIYREAMSLIQEGKTVYFEIIDGVINIIVE